MHSTLAAIAAWLSEKKKTKNMSTPLGTTRQSISRGEDSIIFFF